MTIYTTILLGATAGALISLATLLAFYFIARKKVITNLTYRLKKELQNNPEQSHLILNEALDHLLSSLKTQIPMGSMILSGSLLEKLKEKLTEELGIILPDLLPRLILKMKSGLKQELLKQFREILPWLLCVGSVLGGLCGFVVFMFYR